MGVSSGIEHVAREIAVFRRKMRVRESFVGGQNGLVGGFRGDFSRDLLLSCDTLYLQSLRTCWQKRARNASAPSLGIACGGTSRIFASMRGLARWKDAFKAMRRNCETDWAQVYPQYAVSAWIGHGIEVSARHYLQVPEEFYDEVAAANKAKTATKTATKSQAEPATARRKF